MGFNDVVGRLLFGRKVTGPYKTGLYSDVRIFVTRIAVSLLHFQQGAQGTSGAMRRYCAPYLIRGSRNTYSGGWELNWHRRRIRPSLPSAFRCGTSQGQPGFA